MSSAPFLRTLDRPTLTTRAGTVRWDDPRSFALLVMLALDGPAGLEEQEVLLRLAPDLTPSRARETLAACIEEVERALGVGAVVQSGDRVRLTSPLAVDVVPLAGGSAAGGRFLTRFSLPDNPEFTDWATRTRAGVMETPRDEPERARAPRRALTMAGTGLVLLIAALVFVRRAPANRLPPGALVVVADVENQTGDTVFDHGLTLATGIALQQAGNIQPLPQSRVLAALRRSGRRGSDSLLTLAVASDVAQREGIAWVVVPRIESADGGYRVGVTILDASSRDTIAAEEAPAEGRGGVLPALDQVVRAAQRDLAPRPERAPVGQTLPFVTTSSLEALRSYAEGGRAWSRNDFRMAREFWARALDLDSGFAMAMGAMGSWSYYHTHRDEGYRYFEAALARADRLTDYERLHLANRWAGYRGLHDSALLIGRQIAERFPSGVTWFDYGTDLMQAGKCDDATAALRRAITLDSAFAPAHINIATCLRRDSRWGDAVREYELAARFEPEVLRRGNVGFEFGSTLALAGLRDSAERHFARLQDAPGLFERALGARGRGWIAWFEGKPGEAAQHFDAAVFASRQQNAANSLIRGLALSGRAHTAAGDTVAAAKAFDEMMTLIASSDQIPPLLALVGTSLAASGRVGDAELLLRKIRAPRKTHDAGDAPAAYALTGAIALARGDGLAALAALDQAGGFVQPITVTLLRAKALDRLGRSDSAAALRRAVGREHVFGVESGFEWVEETPR